MLYETQDLIKKCLNYIKRYTAQILNSEGFLSLNRETLQSIFRLDSLSVCEDTMVTALLKWAETRLNYRAEAGENHEHTQVGSVFNGFLDKIRVKSLTENKIKELMESENDLAVQLAFMICVMKERLPSSTDDDSDSDDAQYSHGAADWESDVRRCSDVVIAVGVQRSRLFTAGCRDLGINHNSQDRLTGPSP